MIQRMPDFRTSPTYKTIKIGGLWVIHSLVKPNFSTNYQQLVLPNFAYIGSKSDRMEEYYRFILPAIFFVIYLINQIRKMKKQAEAQRELQPQTEPVKPVMAKPVVQTSNQSFDYKGKREMKTRERKPTFSKKEVERKPIVYKPVADEELIAEALLEDRKIQEKALKEDRKPLTDEHLEPYASGQSKSKMNLDWLKDKANLKRTFIAAEIFQRKYW